MKGSPKEELKRQRPYVGILAAAAVLVLAGLCIAGVLKKADPLPAAASAAPIAEEPIPAASAKEIADGDPAQYGRLRLAVPPYITSGSRLYFHAADTSSELTLSELKEEAYGFAGDPVEYELLSGSGELSDRIYLRNPQGDPADTTGDWPLYWVFDYVCDASQEYQGRTLWGRYGLFAEDDSIYPGKLLMQGDVEVYECLTGGDEPMEDLYILKVNADLSDILDAGAESAEASGTWWEMMSALEADLPEEWAILLLASPDWDLRS